MIKTFLLAMTLTLLSTQTFAGFISGAHHVECLDKAAKCESALKRMLGEFGCQAKNLDCHFQSIISSCSFTSELCMGPTNKNEDAYQKDATQVKLFCAQGYDLKSSGKGSDIRWHHHGDNLVLSSTFFMCVKKPKATASEPQQEPGSSPAK
jgi:hypothetical protein